MELNAFNKINSIHYMDEEARIKELLKFLEPKYKKIQSRVYQRAEEIVNFARNESKIVSPIESLLQEFQLNTKEGTVLLCLAEALLRIPDSKTMDRLLEDKFTSADWKKHTGINKGIFVNASSWSFFLTGKILDKKTNDKLHLEETYKSIIKKTSEPVFRVAVKRAVTILASQFVFKPTMKESIGFTKSKMYSNNLFSFDMLGEGARNMEDAEKYFEDYKNSIHYAGKELKNSEDIRFSNGVSIKISALHPRYERNKIDDLKKELIPKLITLCKLCKDYNIQLCIDAEENYRLILSLILLEIMVSDPSLKGWNGLGLALQAYQKRSFDVIDWIDQLAEKNKKIINVRLVKGAYWDSEIKLAQELGVPNYPVYTRKSSTDISWMACAIKLLEKQNTIFPQFASHNAQSIAFIEEAGKEKTYEFQRIHGMGGKIHDYFNQFSKDNYPKCRIYAPVGNYDDLLPYLMRRLLENGANTSFINKISDPNLNIEEILEDPLQIIKKYSTLPNPMIPVPPNIYLPNRKNSKGYDINDENYRERIGRLFNNITKKEFRYEACSIIDGKDHKTSAFNVFTPFDNSINLGSVHFADDNIIDKAIEISSTYFPNWNVVNVDERVKIIIRFAELLEENQEKLLKICTLEAGKTVVDSINDIRESIDFCYYYSREALRLFSSSIKLDGPTGEINELHYEGKGIYLTISPWNFPIAIFIGQIVAPLLAGNTIIAKPAEQTSIIAYEIMKLFLKAGLPQGALQLLLGNGPQIGEKVIKDQRVKGVIFTGSNETAKKIQNIINNRQGEIISFIAETGGLNVMIVDSSALTEQVIDDAIDSGFGSAGQRCSALRIMAIQEEVFDRTVKMLNGALQKIHIGDPRMLETDIGPVIDKDAENKINKHINLNKNNILSQTKINNEFEGNFIQPTVININKIGDLKEEIFGPVVHVVKYKSNKLEELVDEINKLNYGLTLGIQSRIDNTINYIFNNAKVGNIYINRNIVGAVVGVQPFGGRGLSGTGAKAGGPNYLMQFVNEKTFTYNTTAAGGNASLMMLEENK
ncbi:MAG: Bifunctional protein PutA [Alphaproteobacteria bacterium MarineAlpha5_Bin11]|nr:MAG: Bifunctional protein PutA [Alphaproteobacteria bacterium MarineAlpha5_Bin11]PPR51483.1 MAG: Bifunctional protein PutA [Alphaproteobacteria bacterium MarineAlpha5_Bin10]|tara:strand:+ start:430 stop:3558 length:3129 start_codon:yes stop_codon:yes gene_type:complete